MTRLLIVCRQYWPICSESSYRLTEQANLLSRAGVQVTILTTRWHSRWPAHSAFRDWQVFRILPPVTSLWSDSFFLRNIWQWMERYSAEYDAFYFDSLSVLLSGKLSPKLREKQLLIRFETRSRKPANSGQLAISESLKRNTRVQFLVSSAHEHRVALSKEIDESQINRLRATMWRSYQRTEASISAARQSLSQISTDFLVPQNLPLVIVFFENQSIDEEHRFVKQLAEAMESLPRFRIWVFGSGDSVRRHHALLRDRSCHNDVLLHSSMDDLELLYQAADLLICPAAAVGRQFYHATAFASALPTLHSPEERDELSQEIERNFDFDNGSMHGENLIERLRQFLIDPSKAIREADSFRLSVDWALHEKRLADAWLALLNDRA